MNAGLLLVRSTFVALRCPTEFMVIYAAPFGVQGLGVAV